MSRDFSPARWASMPQASPVGPAPTIITSRVSDIPGEPLQHHPLIPSSERRGLSNSPPALGGGQGVVGASAIQTCMLVKSNLDKPTLCPPVFGALTHARAQTFKFRRVFFKGLQSQVEEFIDHGSHAAYLSRYGSPALRIGFRALHPARRRQSACVALARR